MPTSGIIGNLVSTSANPYDGPADSATVLQHPEQGAPPDYGADEQGARFPQEDLAATSKQYLYSFSGADARCYTWFPQQPADIQLLRTLHTISISVHEAKGSARRLGHRGISGHSRGVRTIAGSLILTVVNDHPLASLMRQWTRAAKSNVYGWSLDRELIGVGTLGNELLLDSILPTLLPPFDLAMYYASEASDVVRHLDQETGETTTHAEGAALLLRGIEFQDDGFVTSVNDIVSEVTLSFTAFDYKPLARIDRDGLENIVSKTSSVFQQQLELQRRIQGT